MEVVQLSRSVRRGLSAQIWGETKVDIDWDDVEGTLLEQLESKESPEICENLRYLRHSGQRLFEHVPQVSAVRLLMVSLEHLTSAGQVCALRLSQLDPSRDELTLEMQPHHFCRVLLRLKLSPRGSLARSSAQLFKTVQSVAAENMAMKPQPHRDEESVRRDARLAAIKNRFERVPDRCAVDSMLLCADGLISTAYRGGRACHRRCTTSKLLTQFLTELVPEQFPNAEAFVAALAEGVRIEMLERSDGREVLWVYVTEAGQVRLAQLLA